MKSTVVILFIICVNLFANAQEDIRGPIPFGPNGTHDGVPIEENIPTKKVIPYEFVREADVMWSKQVWRIIDLREKFNHPLYYPLDDIRPGEIEGTYVWRKNTTRWSLWTVIRYHILNGDLTLYSPFDPDWVEWNDGDMFKYPITTEKYGFLPNGNFYTDSVYRDYVKGMEYLGAEVFDPNPTAIESIAFPGQDSVDNHNETVYYPNEFNWYTSKDIIQYKLKEVWFFDKERSVLDVRIIGICPVIYQKDNQGNISGFKELFWLYFPECRYVFQNFFVQSRQNDSQRMSFDDLFWKRMFHSYIEKESNIYDRPIETYKSGTDALLESNRIKEKILYFEHDLWSF